MRIPKRVPPTPNPPCAEAQGLNQKSPLPTLGLLSAAVTADPNCKDPMRLPQRAQYHLIEQYTLNHNIKAPIIYGIFLI